MEEIGLMLGGAHDMHDAQSGDRAMIVLEKRPTPSRFWGAATPVAR
jgi:hypothetical protein